MELLIGCGLVFILVISLTINMAINNAKSCQDGDVHWVMKKY